MTQQPVGEVCLIDENGRQDVAYERHDLYTRSVGEFTKAVSGRGRPAADGVDGVKSLAVALAVRDSASAGNVVSVDYAGV